MPGGVCILFKDEKRKTASPASRSVANGSGGIRRLENRWELEPLGNPSGRTGDVELANGMMLPHMMLPQVYESPAILVSC
jgi:hypothetical protein